MDTHIEEELDMFWDFGFANTTSLLIFISMISIWIFCHKLLGLVTI